MSNLDSRYAGIDFDEKMTKTLKSLKEVLGDKEKRELLIGFLEIRKEKMNNLSEAGMALFNMVESSSEFGIKNEASSPFATIEFSAKIDDAIEQNSYAGWPLSQSMDIISYININNCASGIDRNEQFTALFEENNKELYESEKAHILTNIDDKNRELAKQVFDAFEINNLLITIPSLIMLVEGILAEMLSSSDIGNKLLGKFTDQIDQGKSDFDTLIAMSLSKFLKDKMFKYLSFDEARAKELNRNWVLHGRDDVRLWNKEDFYSLLCIISGILTVKHLIK